MSWQTAPRQRDRRARRLRVYGARLLALLACLLVLANPRAQTEVSPLTSFDFELLGLSLAVAPATLTVPRDIPTSIAADLVLPAAAGPAASAALADLRTNARVRAVLRGPGMRPRLLEARPGDPLPLPPFALAGDYVLEEIRLVRPSAAGTPVEQVLLDGQPARVPIRVIDEVLVTSVTSRPLDLDEIRGRGIIIDERNFDLREFQLALNVDGTPLTIRLPVALPTRELLAFDQPPELLVERLRGVNADLAERQTVELPPGFERPGIDFSVAAVPFVPVEGDEGGRAFIAPPITGLVIIPGNVAFLNQFFSVLVTVANVAPDDSLLSVRDLHAEIRLPPGPDLVPGTPDDPGDDPLRLARLAATAGAPRASVPVVQPGPDGLLGTADDLQWLPPATQGQAEFLVEGLREGLHRVAISLHGVLDGLPSGPVEITGEAAGAVLVRDPTFDLALAHPRTVRAGEPYDLYVTVTNSSSVPANLVSLELPPGGLSGVALAPTSPASIVIDSLAPGEAFTQRFQLIAQKTGQVTAASFNAETGVTGRFQLSTGVDERGVPLAPNAIALPHTVAALPPTLVEAALRVLGQALGVATTPTAALPPGVRRVERATLTAGGQALGQAGLRLGLGEAPAAVLADLLLDWLGLAVADTGFAQLLRETSAGAALFAAFGSALADSGAREDLLAILTRQAVVGAGATIAVVGDGPGPAPVTLAFTPELPDAADGVVAALLPLITAASDDPGADVGEDAGRLAVRLAPTAPALRLHAVASGRFDLGLSVADGDGAALLLDWSQIPIDAGAEAWVEAGADGDWLLRVATGAAAPPAVYPPARSRVEAAAPALVRAEQLTAYDFGNPGHPMDPATYGLLLGLLFDQPLDPASATDPAHYQVPGIGVLGAALQPGGRLVTLYLERPIGTLVPREIEIAGVRNQRGHPVATTRSAIQTRLGDGARVFGQVLDAEGTPVPNALLSLTVVISVDFAFTVASVRTDASGAFDFDFVPRLGNHFRLEAQDPRDARRTELRAVVRAAGQELLLYPTFIGRGRVVGSVTDAQGRPVAGAPVWLSASGPSVPPGTNADALGRFVIDGVPVGTYGLRSDDGRGAVALATGVLERAGTEARTDLQLVLPRASLGGVQGRVFLADGRTPAAGFDVYLGRYDRTTDSLAALALTTTDADGAFVLADLPAEPHDLVALAPDGREFGLTRVRLEAGRTISALVVMEATGVVEGIVYDAQGRPVAGAVIAGGLTLGYSGPDGRFRIDAVPAGNRRIEAGDPVTRRRGAAEVTVRSGASVTAEIHLEARASIEGRVLDAAGHPVPHATVRLVQSGGYSFVFANAAGAFRFPDLRLGDYLLQAPGPDQAGLIAWMEKEGIPVCSAFTARPPDAPARYNCDAPDPTTADPTPGGVADLMAAMGRGLARLFARSDTELAGPPAADPSGGFGWRRVTLANDSVTELTDLRYLSLGNVSGTTVAGNGLPLGAAVRVTGLVPGAAGGPRLRELARLTTDPATGAFQFSGIARFDLESFQNTRIRAGGYLLEAVSALEPGTATARGQLDANTPNVTGIELRFAPATETRGTLRGQVWQPDGVTPVAAGVEVRIGYGDGIELRTDADGGFVSAFPIPRGGYAVTALDLATGATAQVHAWVEPGAETPLEITLLGRGDLHLRVLTPAGTPVPGAAVTLTRRDYPYTPVQGLTDAAGIARLTGVTEGPFAVVAEAPGTALRGRASGVIVRAVETSLDLTLEGAGTVSGTFLTSDGRDPVANAAVELRTRQVLAYANTDAAGRFRLDAIPLGPFTLTALDPLTARRGQASETLSRPDELLDLVVLQGGRGQVGGRVTEADGVTPVAGAPVSLSLSGSPGLQSVTRADGSFEFPGVSVGRFRLAASDPLFAGFHASSEGELRFDGEVVSRDLNLSGFGALTVLVSDAVGGIAGNARVTLSGPVSRDGVVDAGGRIDFERLPLGQYQISAEALDEPGNLGDASAGLEQQGDAPSAAVALRGVGALEVTVLDADGVPAAGARVRLVASARLPDETSLPDRSQQFIAFTGADGQVRIDGIPRGSFSVMAELGPVAASGEGQIEAPGALAALTLTLGATGRLHGRVLLPDGLAPAVAAPVTVRFPPQSGLQSGTLQVTTDLQGGFAIAGIPLGAVSLSAAEASSMGVYRAELTLTPAADDLDLGDLLLDNRPPRVLTLSPPDGATGVPLDAAIEIDFDEPMAPASFDRENFQLRADGVSVPGSLGLTMDDTRLRFVPAAPLVSEQSYEIALAAVPGGPTDRVGLPLQVPLTSRFTAADLTPPALLALDPPDGAREVQPRQVIRATFSEPLAEVPVLTLEVDGAEVRATVDLILGGSVAVLTPAAPLAPNRDYRLVLDAVRDLAGNPLPGQPLTFGFASLDTEPPLLTGLALAAPGSDAAPSLVAGSGLVLTPLSEADDIARVEYLIGSTARVVTTAPFALSITLPPTAGPLPVSAVAVDRAGNPSAPVLLDLDLLPDRPPQVQLRALDCDGSAGSGETCRFEVAASDDTGLTELLFAATGAASLTATRAVDAATTATAQFSLEVPAEAASAASILVSAAARDLAGQITAATPLQLRVRDAIAPVVSLPSPVDNAVVLPGSVVPVLVRASDDTALAAVTLTCTPALVGCERRPLDGVATAEVPFAIEVPADLVAPAAIALTATAEDLAGNRGSAPVKGLRLADTLAPIITELVASDGATLVAPGQAVQVRASASDNVRLAAIEWRADGAGLAIGPVLTPVPGAVASGSIDIDLTLPAAAADGSLLTLTAVALDAAGNRSLPVELPLSVRDPVQHDTQAPTVQILSPAPGSAIDTGASLTLAVTASDDVGVTEVRLSSHGVRDDLVASQVFGPLQPQVSTELTLALPADGPAGTLTLVVVALDAAGNQSTAATLDLLLVDSLAPTVRILTPAADAEHDPTEPLGVSVAATDNLGVTSLTLTASGAVDFVTTRTLTAPQPAVTVQFEVPFLVLPATAAPLTLQVTARDAAGNTASADPVTLLLLDRSGPRVLQVSPADGASDQPLETLVTLRFNEPVAADSLGAVTLRATDGTPVETSATLDASGRVLTLTPRADALTAGATYLIGVGAGLLDLAGNPATPFSAGFSIAQPDQTPPRVTSSTPATGATGVSPSVRPRVGFSEPMDPASLDGVWLVLDPAGAATPLAGTASLSANGQVLTFTPAALLPLDADLALLLPPTLRDLAGNALVDASGAALSAPLAIGFRTGTFALTSPVADASLPAGGEVLIEARASAGLGIAAVEFQVDGVSIGTLTTAPFSLRYPVPASGPITLEAFARDAAGNLLATDRLTLEVAPGLSLTPRLLGLAPGATATLTLRRSRPAEAPIAIALRSNQPGALTLPELVFLPAGAQQAEIEIAALGLAGRPVRNVEVSAEEAAGTAPARATVSISAPIPGQTLRPLAAPVGLSVRQAPLLGTLTLPVGVTRQVDLALPAPVAATTLPLVSVTPPTRLNVEVAGPIPAGSARLPLTLTSAEPGSALVTLRVGTAVYGLAVQVGEPAAGAVPPVLAAPVGLLVHAPSSLGRLVLPDAGTRRVLLPFLDEPATVDTPIRVTSSDPAIIDLAAPALVPAGARTLTLDLIAGAQGWAELSLSGAGRSRTLGVRVGLPEPGDVPPILAPPVGVAVRARPVLGRILLPTGDSRTLTLPFLPAPLATDTQVQVSGIDPLVVRLPPTLMIPAGATDLVLPLAAGPVGGTAELVLTGGGLTRALSVQVGPIEPDAVPPVLAPPVGLEVAPGTTP